MLNASATAPKGLVSPTGRRKPAFFVLQGFYKQKEAGQKDAARK